MSEQPPGRGRHLLLVDDDETFRERLAEAFRLRAFVVSTAWDYESALASAAEQPPEMALVDLNMPGPSGLEVVEQLSARCPGVEIVVLTGYGSVATAVDAVRLGACNYMHKPAHADMILAAFERGRTPPLLPPEPRYSPPSLARAEWEHIQRAMADCGGNVSKAARMLGLHRRTLQRKLMKYPPRD